MGVTCARCREAEIGRSKLEAETAGEANHRFCGNAGAIDGLLTAQM
jgi:hypothetical protein